MFQFTVY